MHRSNLANKIDPRVDSHSGPRPQTSQEVGTAATTGSSTTPAAAPSVQDTTRSQYDPYVSGYNPGTGSGYVPHSSSPGYSAQDNRAEYAPSTLNKSPGATPATEGSKERKGSQAGRGIQSFMAGVHVCLPPAKISD